MIGITKCEKNFVNRLGGITPCGPLDPSLVRMGFRMLEEQGSGVFGIVWGCYRDGREGIWSVSQMCADLS